MNAYMYIYTHFVFHCSLLILIYYYTYYYYYFHSHTKSSTGFRYNKTGNNYHNKVQSNTGNTTLDGSLYTPTSTGVLVEIIDRQRPMLAAQLIRMNVNRGSEKKRSEVSEQGEKERDEVSGSVANEVS